MELDRLKRDVAENEGSLARDHLANERTFLAWVRTALAVIGLGVVVGKLVETDGVFAELIGLGMVSFGAAMLVYSVVRFEHVTRLLGEGRFVAARLGPLLVAALGLVVAIGSVVLLVL
jgi:putative membrane protein